MAARKKYPDFESALSELENIIEQLESGDLSLDESLKAFESGIRLTRDCQQRLTEAEQKVQKLVAEQGQLKLEDFDELDDSDDSY
ncbi:exodeoxyribonuclease VII small subunit [Sessilibacter sp. MAH2]